MLLVEDEDVLRVAIAKVLGRRGYSVLSVGDGQGAVKIFKARAREIHTVVLDITLPGLSGWMCCGRSVESIRWRG